MSTQLIRPSRDFVFIERSTADSSYNSDATFLIQERTGCFTYSGQKTSDIVSTMTPSTSIKSVPVTRAYRLGVRIALLYLIRSHYHVTCYHLGLKPSFY